MRYEGGTDTSNVNIIELVQYAVVIDFNPSTVKR